MVDHVPVWYRIFYRGESVLWIPPRDLAEVLLAFKCVVDYGSRTIDLI